MKTNWIVFSAALAASLLAVEAQAGGSGHSSHSMSSVSRPSFSNSHVYQPSNTGKSTGKSPGQILGKYNGASGPTKFTGLSTNGPTNKLNANTGLNFNKSKGFDKLSFDKSMKFKNYCGKNSWGCGWGGFCGWGGWSGYWNDWCCGGSWPGYYCYQPWYYTPCYNVCCEYYAPEYGSYSVIQPTFSPTADNSKAMATDEKIVHIMNPADTQASLAFAVNGQTYSLEAGQSKDVRIDSDSVIEFDRGSGDENGRYTLSEGTYRFASTQKGWELYKAGNEPLTDSVATN
jgi:hypothetical protein